MSKQRNQVGFVAKKLEIFYRTLHNNSERVFLLHSQELHDTHEPIFAVR
jgi:hypothetical protein